MEHLPELGMNVESFAVTTVAAVIVYAMTWAIGRFGFKTSRKLRALLPTIAAIAATGLVAVYVFLSGADVISGDTLLAAAVVLLKSILAHDQTKVLVKALAEDKASSVEPTPDNAPPTAPDGATAHEGGKGDI